MSSIYQINKGIGKPIVFKGLKAQWIWWLGGGVVGLLLILAAVYIVGVSLIVCVSLVGLSGVGLFVAMYRLSRKYGEYGLMKRMAQQSVPKGLKGSSRKCVERLVRDENSERGIARMVRRK
jgi:hypothetical protein